MEGLVSVRPGRHLSAFGTRKKRSHVARKRFAAAFRAVAIVVSTALAFAGLIFVGSTSYAESSLIAGLQVTKSGPSSVTPGQTITYDVVITNTLSETAYNVAVSDSLPSGLTFVSGTVVVDKPYSFGNPVVTAVTGTGGIATGATTLDWSNLLDLAAGQSIEFQYQAVVSSTAATGSSYTNSVTAAASLDPWKSPSEAADSGKEVTTTSDSVLSQTATVSTIVVRKDQSLNSTSHSGGAWYRGLHDEQRKISLNIYNSGDAQTVTVVDYLPAAAEFLGAVDNSAANEWTSGGTSSRPISASNPSLMPTTVETVQNPDGHTGVYTKITWTNVAIVAGTNTISYYAAIPLRENTTTWSGATPSATCSSTNCPQASNLDNNNGDYTRNLVDTTITNYVSVLNPDTATVLSSDYEDYTVKDFTQSKSVHQINGAPAASSALSGGTEYVYDPWALTWFQLTSKVSEYVSGDNLVVEDTLPDGMLPVLPTTSSIAYNQIYSAVTSGTPSVSSTDLAEWQKRNADLSSGLSYDTSAAGGAVTKNADGTFTIRLIANSTLARDASVTALLPAFDAKHYTSSGKLILSGDRLTNTVTGSVTTSAAVDQEQSDANTADEHKLLSDSASARLFSPFAALTKEVLPSEDSAAYLSDATTHSSDFVSSLTGTSDTKFNYGDLVWFRLTFGGDDTMQLGTPILKDLLPAGLTAYEWRYASGSNYTTGWTASSTVSGSTVTVAPNTDVRSSSISKLVWTPTTEASVMPDPDTGTAKTLVIDVAAVVTSSSTTASTLTNLAKATTTSSSGSLLTYRGQSSIDTSATPTLGITKTVTSVDGAQPTVNSAGEAVVNGGDTVVYTVAVTNNSSQAASAVAIRDTYVGAASNVAVYSDASLSTAVATTTGTDSAGANYVDWSAATIAAAASVSYWVQLTLPSTPLVNTTFVNNVGVKTFQTALNWTDSSATTTTWTPASNIDPDLTTSNTTAVNASATVRVKDVTTTQQVRSAVSATNNNGSCTGTVTASTGACTGTTNAAGIYGTSAQAVVGESVTYQITITVPAKTTVSNGALVDTLSPTTAPSVAFDISSSVLPSVTASVGGSAIDISFSSVSGTGFTASLPATFTNSTDTDIVYTITVPATVTNDSAPTSTSTIAVTNGTSFTSDTSTTSTTSTSVYVVQPTLGLTKAVSPSSGLIAGQTLTYTVTASNGTTSPAAYNPVLTDTLPIGVSNVTVTSVTVGGTTLTEGYTVSAPSGTTTSSDRTLTITTTGQKVITGSNIVVTYTVTLPSTLTAYSAYTNYVSLSATSLDGSGKTYTKVASATARGVKPSITKTVSSSSTQIGNTVTWTIVATLPANVSYTSPYVTDTLPNGITWDTSNVSYTTVDSGGTLSPTVSKNGQVLTVSLASGTLASSSSARSITILIVGTVNSTSNTATTATISNTGYLHWTSSNGDGTASDQNLSSSASTAIIHPTVSIAKSVSDSTPEPGESFTYTMTVSNTSTTATAYNVAVSDTQPTGVEFQSVSSDNGGTLSAGAANWTIPSLSPGASTSVTITAKLAASSTLSTGTTLTNTATIGSWQSAASGGITYTSSSRPSGQTAAALTSSASITPDFPAVTSTKALASGQSSTVYRGDNVSYVLTIHNGSNATAYQVSANDVLPANWTYVATQSVTVAGAAVSPATEPSTTSNADGTTTLVWADDGWSLAPGKDLVIAYTAKAGTLATAGTNHVNTLTASAQDATGATANATANYATGSSQASVYIGQADLSVDKVADGSWTPGISSSATNAPHWTITVTNNGNDDAYGPFQIVDTATNPTGVTDSVIQDSSGHQLTGSGTAASPYLYGDTSTKLSKGDTLTFTIPVTIASSAVGTAQNTAIVTSATADDGLSNNTASASATLVPSADLQITKTGPSTVHAGDSVTWTVTVTNGGPSTSYADVDHPITVTDVLPSQVGGASVAWGSGNADGDTVTISNGTVTATRVNNLASGASESFTITATVGSSVTSTFSNTATVTAGSTTDPDTSNNTATWTPGTISTSTTIVATKKLTTTPTSGKLVPGDTAKYLLTVTNSGTADARNVVINDPLPTQLSYASYTNDTGSWSSSAQAGDSHASFALNGTLAPGASASVLLTVAVADPLTDSTQVVNTIVASADNALDATGTWTTETQGIANLSIAKAYTSASETIDGNPVAGGTITYTVTVTNHGPSTSPASASAPITVTDALPAGFSYVSSSGTDGFSYTSTTDGAPVFARTTPLSVGASAQFTVTAKIPADYLNGASSVKTTNTVVVAGPNDTDPSDNTASADATVVDHAALVVTKRVSATDPSTDSGNPVAGGTITYSITVKNAGPSAARTVSLSDVVPAGMTLTSFTAPTGWTLSAGNVFTKAGLLLVDETQTFTLKGTIDPGYATGLSSGQTRDLTNTAVVTWIDSSSASAQSARDSVTSHVEASADVSVTKTASVSSVIAGSTFSYALAVKNQGPSTSDGPLTVTDELPAGLTFVSFAGGSGEWTGGATTADPQKLVFTRTAALSPNASATPIVVTVKAADNLVTQASQSVSLTNTATLDPGVTADPDSANNTSTITVPVEANVDLSIGISHVGTAQIGDTQAFAVAVENAGPSQATGVAVTVTLPEGLKFVDISGSSSAWSIASQQSSTTSSGTTVTEVVLHYSGTLSAAERASDLVIRALVEVGAYPAATLSGSVTNQLTDTDLSNNTAQDSLSVSPDYRYGITKKATTVLKAGSQASYEIGITNEGPTSDPNSVTVTDDLPSGLSYVSATATGATCSANGQLVTCVFDASDTPVSVGTTRTIALTVLVASGAPSSVTNVATVITRQVSDTETVEAQATNTVIPLTLTDTRANGAPFALLAAAVLAILSGAVMLAVWRIRRKQS